MQVVTLEDLADVVVEEYANKYGHKKESIKRKTIGLRPGEKKFEELMTETEAKLAFETDDMLVIPPQISLPNIRYEATEYEGAKKSKLTRYISRDVKPLSKDEIRKLLFELK